MKVLCALLFAVAATAAGAAAADPPEAWLARMSRALATREYTGTFVYTHGGRIDTMRVVRTIGPNGPRDEVVSLSGEPRGVVRENGELRSTGNGVTTTVSSAPMALFRVAPVELLGAAGHYRLSVLGEDRVAGYPTTVVEARPTDASRYGYRLWIERDSGLLLRSALAATDGNTIEQLVFTTLELGPEAADAPAPEAEPPAAELPGPRFTQPLPAGFRLVAVQPEQNGRRHYVYSDGLANVSLYVEPVTPNLEAITGALQRGAINLFGHVARDRQIVVVGDVPAGTAQRIAVTLDPDSAR